MRKCIKIDLVAADRQPLTAIVTDRNSPQKQVWRASIVRLTAEGCGSMELTRWTGTSQTSVWRWQDRFLADGVSGLLRDKTRRSRIPPLSADVQAQAVVATQAAPPGETTHWTSGAMAKPIGVSVSSVQRIGRAHGLQPHKMRLFELSKDLRLAEKVVDIVGLYINPPEHGVVLSIDEKSQIQALDRTQPGLPMKKGRCGTMTHDYKRNGTTTLFAALNVLDGTVIGRCMQRHRHEEVIRFPNVTEAAVPKGRAIHAIVDNSATHKHPKVKQWLEHHPRWTFRFTATSASWLNAVEGYFAKARQAAPAAQRIPLGRRASGRHQAVPRGDQRQPKTFPLDKEPQQDHRRRQKKTPSVRFYPVGVLRKTQPYASAPVHNPAR